MKSMQPIVNTTENNKDFVFVLRLFSLKHLFNEPLVEEVINRGDIVSIKSPKNANECYLKRIVGMPGDLVKTINYKHDYVMVPEGHCWIEGDNFKRSYDSNSFGCVPLALVLGKAHYIIYPFNRISRLDTCLPSHRQIITRENYHLIDFKQSSNESDTMS
jgi:inner membrane protease subunit 2